ncbi:MAG: calcium/sodium antiporter [Crocinitomicaceae bacterium]
MSYLWLIMGLAVLIAGGEFLVRGAVGIAKRAKISTLVIGMTVISFGTSAPELFVSIGSALEGNPEIAIGNVVGSNIANIALVLGITVLIFPIAVDRNSKIIDWPMMMLATILFIAFSWDLQIVFWEGAVLFGILLTFTYLLIRNSRKNNKIISAEDQSAEDIPKPVLLSVGFTLLGLVGLYFGAEWLIKGAVGIAESFHMEKRIIGLTVVAFGTSVPELVTSAVAAFKKETDISIGNLIGSNIFNIMAVIGVTAMVKTTAVDAEVVASDIWWMALISLSLLPMMIIGKKVGRLKGFMLVSTYVIYISLIIISG